MSSLPFFSLVGVVLSQNELWDSTFSSVESSRLGWFEERPESSLNLLSLCTGLSETDLVVDVGAGTATFVDNLLAWGFRDVVVSDISSQALDIVRARLGEAQRGLVRFIAEDITRPAVLPTLRGVGLWHDRALLHFLVEERDRAAYLSTLKAVLKLGGYAIIAVFSPEGAKMCNGQDVVNFNEEMLSAFLGPEFKLLQGHRHTHVTPHGQERPYVYTLFQRIK